MFSTANELGIGVMAYGPLAHGLLTGAFTLGMKFDETDWRRQGMLFGQALFAPDHFDKNLQVIDQLKGVAARKGVSLPRLALAWVLSNPTVSVGIVGARNVREIEDNVEAVEIKLDSHDLAEIDDIMTGASGQVDFLPQ
jgi:aryl-alcohol dehydrogenase-like predicted oxidoreductase